MDDIPFEPASDALRITAAAVMFLVRFIDEYFRPSIQRLCLLRPLEQLERERRLLKKMCISKTISNNMICFCFLVWCVPCALMNGYYLPWLGNVIFGLISGWTGYLMGPFAQTCMAINRFIAVYFPYAFMTSYPVDVTSVALGSCWVFSVGSAFTGFRVASAKHLEPPRNVRSTSVSLFQCPSSSKNVIKLY
ncbi:unnamed protein product [Caenorhabditis auriculariae]|uniref:7TM GPCR serpentine receptor class x (Srx) domain-containing protein n=1 Tax=Caenorhabditis auriculariae TaxID=2777116 RepID=A0A8S1HIC5_9PELO|nr:unnamed protein product [Caenorhabditis auriculariae]